jgi:hypothetical protein
MDFALACQFAGGWNWLQPHGQCSEGVGYMLHWKRCCCHLVSAPGSTPGDHLGRQSLSKCIVHWCGFGLLSALCTRGTLVLLVSRNGGHSWTQDFVHWVGNPLEPWYPYSAFGGCLKCLRWFRYRTYNYLSQIVSFQHLQIQICYTPLSRWVNPF